MSNLSYGQEEDAITISNVTCEASGHFIITSVTVKGTIHANRAVEDVQGWLTINGRRIGPDGGPVIDFPPEFGGDARGHSFGNLSAGQTRSFSITGTPIGVSDGDRCGVYFKYKEVDPTPQTESEVLVVDPDSPPIYWTDYGTDKIQHVNLDGSDVQDLITSGLTSPNGLAVDIAGGKLYWADFSTDKIQRANLDGSNVQDLVTSGLDIPSYIALDIAGGKIYWTDNGTDKIQRANLDGSNVQDLVTGLNGPVGLALDIASGKMYWADFGTDKIQRANLDGSNIEDLVTQGLRAPWGIALDVAGGKMYWTDWVTEKIQCANLDGSNVQDLITSGLDSPGDITLDVADGKMYWTHTDWDSTTEKFINGKIQRANLDGSNVEDVVTGLDSPDGIALAIPSQVITPPLTTPDLVIENAEAVPSTVEPGKNFRFYATLKNVGTAASSATTLTYYRSSDAVISTEDTLIRAYPSNPLAVNATIRLNLTITAPTTPGTYYYGVCVDSVTDESNTENNCSIAVSVTVTAPAEVVVDIPDANLRAKIESALGKTSGETISETEMQTLTSLNAQDANINKLTGLETAINLTTLKLGDNSVSDISALVGLTNLTELQLWDNKITNLSSLSGLTNLSKLYLWGNSISDISHLSGLTNLTQLRLNENSITNISTLSNLTNLTQLYLNKNSIADISAVAGLTNLTELVIGDNTISDISYVQNLTKLTWLDMPNNSISDISAVQNLTSLAELIFQNNVVSDLSPLVANTGLGMDDEIDARGNLLSYPSIYTHIPALQARDVIVEYDNRVATAPVKISGDTQQGDIGTTLAQPFVVEVQDSDSVAFEGVPVTYAVTAGGGTLSTTNTTTDADGRAESTLTLGNTVGINTVDVSVEGVSQTISFTATALFPQDYSEEIWSGTITVGSWGNAWGNGNATGFGYSDYYNSGSITNPTFTYRGTTYTIKEFGYAKIGNNPIHRYVLTLDKAFPSCDKKVLRFQSLKLSEAGTGGHFDGSPFYVWHGQWIGWDPIGNKWVHSLTLHPTVPEAPVVTAINEGSQVKLSWDTPCDGGKDIIRHEYQQRKKDGDFGGWIPIPDSGADGANVASYTIADVTNPDDHIFEVRAVSAIGNGAVSQPTSPSDRTPQVAEAILNVVKLDYPNVTSFADITDSQLAGITALFLGNRNITALKSGDFDGLTALTELRLNNNQLSSLPADIFNGLTALRSLSLYNNQLSSLPDGIFEGLTSLTSIRLGRNAVDPIPLTVSLEKVADGQFKAVTPSGAPFDMVLPISVTNGTISDGATSITINTGSIESETLTVTRTAGAIDAVTVDIGTLPQLPSNHFGYALVKSTNLPVAVLETLKGDVNGDGIVDVKDLVYVSERYGKTDTTADVNGDGIVNIDDLILIAAVLDAQAAAAPSLSNTSLEGLSVSDVQKWLSEAQNRNLTDPTSLKGILFLQQLLIALTPKETALLPNYPNPFNPETWIPYQLAKPADVSLTIYDIQGNIVRSLDLGYKSAGLYQNRTRAVYWDGRNNIGEKVVSGLYFYTLSAGNFSATRKMLILK